MWCLTITKITEFCYFFSIYARNLFYPHIKTCYTVPTLLPQSDNNVHRTYIIMCYSYALKYLHVNAALFTQERHLKKIKYRCMVNKTILKSLWYLHGIFIISFF